MKLESLVNYLRHEALKSRIDVGKVRIHEANILADALHGVRDNERLSHGNSYFWLERENNHAV